MMYIEIREAAFINKGAELMLRAIISKMRESLPEAKLVMEPNLKIAPYIKRAELGLYQKVWLQYYNIQWGYFGSVIPKKLRNLYGLVLDSEIDVILDASGFSYSDQWGPKSSCVTANAIKKWKKRGTKVILMPQAFGPFKDKKIRDAFKIVIEHADLIFARDRISLGYIEELSGKRGNIKIAPDFTNLIEGELPSDFDAKSNRYCIIPNYRMIDKVQEQDRNKYLTFLMSCAKYLYRNNKKPYFLIHEGEEDLCLAERIAGEFKGEIKVIRETNPLLIKGIIGASEGVIGSRFHGLASSLAQGIPALCIGWSHKYQMLFEDYKFPEGILSLNSREEEIQAKIDLITSDIKKKEIMETIGVAAGIHKIEALRMWDEILTLIKTTVH